MMPSGPILSDAQRREFDVWIVKFIFQLRRGGGCIGGPHTVIHCFVGPVLVIVVLICLTRIVRRISDDDEHGGVLLLCHPLRIFRGEEGEVSGLVRRVHEPEGIERIHEADVLKRFVSPHFLVIGVLNVHRGNVVRQKHHFVAVEFALIFLVQRDARDVLHQPNDEVACADEGIDDVNTAIGERLAEVGFQDMLNAVHHEIDDRLRGIDDTVSIGILDREVLEKALVKRVEEVLLLREIGERPRGVFHRFVEAIETFEELIPIQGPGVSARESPSQSLGR